MAKYPFQKVKPDAPKDIAVAAGAPTTSAELGERIAAWRKRVADIAPEILVLERAGTRPPGTYSPVGGEAIRLLEGLPLAEAAIDTPNERLAALHRERDVLSATISLGEARMVTMLAKEGAVRFEAARPALDAAMRRVALAVAQVERALQERDAIIKEVNVTLPLMEFVGWTLMGRLVDTGTQSFRFLHYAVTRGWLSQRELDVELARVGRKY